MLTRLSKGFSLIEIALVLLIIAILINNVGIPLHQREAQEKFRSAERQLTHLGSVINAFVASQGRLPCPASASSNGNETFDGDRCLISNGFVPATTLGLAGKRNADGLLLDQWNQPVRYHVSKASEWLWFSLNDMKNLKDLSTLTGDLKVCSEDCDISNVSLFTNSAPYVLLSLGEYVRPRGALEIENAGESVIQGNGDYGINANEYFVYTEHKPQTERNAGFDDLLHWESRYVLQRILLDSGFLQ